MTRIKGIEQRLGFPAKVRARGQHTPGVMTKLEQSYAEHLKLRQLAGEVRSWRYEQVKFKLARLTYLTPDFWVIMADNTIEIHEVKAHWEEDARVKMKVAAQLFPEFTWRAFKKPKVKEPWIEEVFGES